MPVGVGAAAFRCALGVSAFSAGRVVMSLAGWGLRRVIRAGDPQVA